MSSQGRSRTATAIVVAYAATALAACAVSTPTPAVHITPANCQFFANLPLVQAAHMLPLEARSAVLCDGDQQIQVPHPAALVALLNRAMAIPLNSAYYCPLDTAAHVSLVVTGLNPKTKQPDGDVVLLHTSGCGFADARSGRWRLTPAAWAAIAKLDPAIRS